MNYCILVKETATKLVYGFKIDRSSTIC